MQHNKIVLAFGSVPKDGGTFTFYRNQRSELLKYGIDMRCVAVGKAQAQLWEDAYADDGCVLLEPHTNKIKKQAKAFAEWCERECVDVVMGINSEAILSAIPHLPEHIRVLSRCANAFDHGYKITLSGYERLMGIVALTPRLRDDLVQQYGAEPKLIRLIPNGIIPERFEEASHTIRGQKDHLMISFLGRLEHNQKGVLHIPGIVRELNKLQVPFRLQIAGKGKHRTEMERQLKEEIQSGQVKFLGALNPDEIPAFLGQTDVYLFTSHFEGCPNALLEAMMAGCVPVSSLIKGITDFVLEEGKTGFIRKKDDYPGFAQIIQELEQDRDRLQLLSNTVSEEARKRFSHTVAAKEYADLISKVMQEKPAAIMPKVWSEFKPDSNFSHSTLERLPFGLYYFLKKIKRNCRM